MTLPVGTVTLEEILDALTLKRLGVLTCTMIIVNTDGYYDPLRQMLENAVQEKFMAPEHEDMWTFVDRAEDVMDAIQHAPKWSPDNFRFAVPHKDPSDFI